MKNSNSMQNMIFPSKTNQSGRNSSNF